MLALLLLLMTAQVPAVPGETTLVSFCKQLRASACQELRRVNPKLADAIEAEALRAAQQLAAQRAADEESSGKDEAKATEAEGEAAPEDSDCQGQNHHAISKRIAQALARHTTLASLYEPRHERFKTRAKDKESHCGYQKWHREVDQEVIQWLQKERKATPEQFEKFLREFYNRPEMRKRFPNGL